MPPFIENFAALGFSSEIIYSFIIIVCSLMIYFGTKELYELTDYKGIRYFRTAFLFFAIAYFFRSFIKFILVYFDIQRILDLSPRILGAFTLLIFLYSSSMAIFYLLHSIIWKKWNHSKLKICLFNLLAIIIAVAGTFFEDNLIYFSLNFVLLLFAGFILLIAYKDYKNKKGNLFAIYLLLFIFWILNIIDILLPKFFEMYNLIIYLASISIFMAILYKVLRKTGN